MIRHLLLCLALLGALPAQAAIFPSGTQVAFTRTFPGGLIPIGQFVTARAEWTNSSSGTISGLYYSEQFPDWINVLSGTVTVNGEPMEFDFEAGEVIVPRMQTYRWILDNPGAPGGRAILGPGDHVVIDYRIRAVMPGVHSTHFDGWFALLGTGEEHAINGWDSHIPILRFESVTDAVPTGPGNHLAPAYPNPFNPSTTLRFESAAHEGRLRLAVVDTAGRELRVLAEGSYAAGSHAVVWDGRDDAGRPLPSGLYLARLTSDHGLEGSQKLLLVK